MMGVVQAMSPFLGWGTGWGNCIQVAVLLKPVRIPIGCSVLFLSDFRDFSDFGYKFRRIPKLYYL